MKKYFLTGLATLLPLLLTYLAISFFFNFLTSPFLGLIHKGLFYLKTSSDTDSYNFLLAHETAVLWAAKIFSLFLLFIFIIAVGAFARFLFIKTLFDLSDAFFRKIPGLRKIYIAVKEALSNLLHEEKATFSQVVLVPYPHKETLAIGFITSNNKPTLSANPEEKLIPVLLPGCPNPMMGFVLLFAEKDVQYTSISVEEALKTIISCGVITSLNK